MDKRLLEDLKRPLDLDWDDIKTVKLNESADGATVDKLNKLPEVIDLYTVIYKYKTALRQASGPVVDKFLKCAEENDLDFTDEVLHLKVVVPRYEGPHIELECNNGSHPLAPFIQRLSNLHIVSPLVNAYNKAADACEKELERIRQQKADARATNAVNRIIAKYNTDSIKTFNLSTDTLNWLADNITKIEVQCPDLPQVKEYFREVTGINPDEYNGRGLSLVSMYDENGNPKHTERGDVIKYGLSSKAYLNPEHEEIPSELVRADWYNDRLDAFTSNELIINTLLNLYRGTFTLGRQQGVVDKKFDNGDSLIADYEVAATDATEEE